MIKTKTTIRTFLTILMLTVFAIIPVQAQQLSKLEKQVRSQLISSSWDGVFDNLAFEVKGSTVTLYGQVLRPSTRTRAEKFVSKLQGVERVVNNIEVLPLSPFDDQIRRQAVYAIANQAGLYGYLQGTNPSLRIIVKNGHVTLEGVVATKTDARLAYFAVNGLPNVFSVTNNLRTEKGSRL